MSASSVLAEILPPQRALDIDEPTLSVVERDDIVKGYEFEKGKFVLFTPDELKALQEASRQTIDIVSFVPQETIDPVYYDKAYLLAPEKHGSKPYSLLHEALRASGRCALASGPGALNNTWCRSVLLTEAWYYNSFAMPKKFDQCAIYRSGARHEAGIAIGSAVNRAYLRGSVRPNPVRR